MLDIWASKQMFFSSSDEIKGLKFCRLAFKVYPKTTEMFSKLRAGMKKAHKTIDTHDPKKTNTKISNNLRLFSPSRKLISDKLFQLRFYFSVFDLSFVSYSQAFSLSIHRKPRAALSRADNFSDVRRCPLPDHSRRSTYLYPTEVRRRQLGTGKAWRAIQDVKYRRNNNHKWFLCWRYFWDWCRYWSNNAVAYVNKSQYNEKRRK